MISILIPHILFLVLLTIKSISAQVFPAGFDGCYNLSSNGQPTGLNPAEFDLPHANMVQCIATCQQSEITSTYAFFWYTPDPTFPDEVSVGNCRCSQIPPPIEQWTRSDAVGDCDVGVVGHPYGAYLTRPPLDFTGCYDVLSPSVPPPVPVQSIEDCLLHCPSRNSQGDNLRYAASQIDQQGTWHCYCLYRESDILPFPESVLSECNTNQYFIYKNNHLVAPSQAVRRRRRDSELERYQARNQIGLCPKGYEACPNSSGNMEEYEGIDTNIEIESCGGCVHGNNPFGVDCTALPGVLPLSILCSKRQCQALACEDGFTLIDGVCVFSP